MQSLYHWISRNPINYTSTQKVPLEDLDKALEHWCTFAALDGADQPKKDAVAFNRIANLLSQCYNDPVKQREWSRRLRIYTILHKIRRLDAMQAFVDGKALDDMLPFPEHELPATLGPSRAAFLEIQKRCLTDAIQLEKGDEGKHVQFSYNADNVHFIHTAPLEEDCMARWTEFGRDLVLKNLQERSSPVAILHTRRKDITTGLRKINALKRLSHRHLVKIKGTYADPKCFAFLMLPVADCNLRQWLDNLQTSNIVSSHDLVILRSFFGCLANAVTYLHDKQVYHMDIKLENILVERAQVYVTDFGAAYDWSQRDRSTTYAALPRTLRYALPEQIADPNAPKNYAIDIWSLGVVFLEMATVLRGLKLKDISVFLRNNRTKHEYFYQNLIATNWWLERLRTREGPEIDNVPLIWVKDMMAQQAGYRPYARQFRGLVFQAQGFCGLCCAFPEEYGDVGSDGSNVDSGSDDSIAEFLVPEETMPSAHARGYAAHQITTVQSWVKQIQTSCIETCTESATNETTTDPWDILDDQGSTNDSIQSEIQEHWAALDGRIPECFANVNLYGEPNDANNSEQVPRPDLDLDNDGFDILSESSASSVVEDTQLISYAVGPSDINVAWQAERQRLDTIDEDVEDPQMAPPDARKFQSDVDLPGSRENLDVNSKSLLLRNQTTTAIWSSRRGLIVGQEPITSDTTQVKKSYSYIQSPPSAQRVEHFVSDQESFATCEEPETPSRASDTQLAHALQRTSFGSSISIVHGVVSSRSSSVASSTNNDAVVELISEASYERKRPVKLEAGTIPASEVGRDDAKRKAKKEVKFNLEEPVPVGSEQDTIAIPDAAKKNVTKDTKTKVQLNANTHVPTKIEENRHTTSETSKKDSKKKIREKAQASTQEIAPAKTESTTPEATELRMSKIKRDVKKEVKTPKPFRRMFTTQEPTEKFGSLQDDNILGNGTRDDSITTPKNGSDSEDFLVATHGRGMPLTAKNLRQLMETPKAPQRKRMW